MARQSSSGRDARQNSQRPMPRSAARRKRERRREQQRQQASPSSRRNRRWLAGGGGAAIVVVIILIVLLTRGSGGGGSPSATASPGPTPTPAPLASLATAASGSTVGGLSCASSEPSSNTTTVHLSIYVNGAQRSIPPGVGIAQPQLTQTIAGPDALNGKCYYPLLTHLGAGIVHVEPPAAGTTYTLGQFFALWGQPLTSTSVGPATGTVTVFVNGSQFSGDPGTVPLTAHAVIQIDVGTATPFQPYPSFPAGDPIGD